MKLFLMNPDNGRNLNTMNDIKPIMTVFAGTNGAGKSTLSMQMRDWLGELVDPDQIARELNPVRDCVSPVPAWSEGVLLKYI